MQKSTTFNGKQFQSSENSLTTLAKYNQASPAQLKQAVNSAVYSALQLTSSSQLGALNALLAMLAETEHAELKKVQKKLHAFLNEKIDTLKLFNHPKYGFKVKYLKPRGERELPEDLILEFTDFEPAKEPRATPAITPKVVEGLVSRFNKRSSEIGAVQAAKEKALLVDAFAVALSELLEGTNNPSLQASLNLFLGGNHEGSPVVEEIEEAKTTAKPKAALLKQPN